jgi:hypothetical protein
LEQFKAITPTFLKMSYTWLGKIQEIKPVYCVEVGEIRSVCDAELEQNE